MCARHFFSCCILDNYFLRICRLCGESTLRFSDTGLCRALAVAVLGQFMLVLHLFQNCLGHVLPVVICSYAFALATARAMECFSGLALHIVQCRRWTLLALGMCTFAVLIASGSGDPVADAAFAVAFVCVLPESLLLWPPRIAGEKLQAAAAEAAAAQSLALGKEVSCTYLGQAYGPSSLRRYRADPNAWRVGGDRPLQTVVTFQWRTLNDDSATEIVEQRADHACERGVSLPQAWARQARLCQVAEGMEVLLRQAAQTAAARRSAEWNVRLECAYLGKYCGHGVLGKIVQFCSKRASTDFEPNPSAWELAAGSRAQDVEIAFHWTNADDEACLHIRYTTPRSVLSHGVPLPAIWLPRTRSQVKESDLHKGAVAAAEYQARKLDLVIPDLVIDCEYLGQRLEDASGVQYIGDPSAWVVPDDVWPSQLKVAFQWCLRGEIKAQALAFEFSSNVRSQGVPFPKILRDQIRSYVGERKAAYETMKTKFTCKFLGMLRPWTGSHGVAAEFEPDARARFARMGEIKCKGKCAAMQVSGAAAA